MNQTLQEARDHGDIIIASMQAMIEEDQAAGDDLVISELHKCLAAVSKIKPEQDRLREEIEKEPNPIRKELLWWQHDHTKVYVEWSAKNAEARLVYLEELNTPEARAEELKKCEEDLLHWFGAWAWSLDPRMPILPVIPFVPFRFQRETLTWLDGLIRIRHTSGMLDKSRDQGVSWLAIGLAVYYFRFLPFAQMLFGSYKEELIDSKEKPDTLLEKARFMLRRLPTWMLPEGFNLKRDMSYMSIANRASGALIQGAAPTEQFGRQGRYTFIVLDEHSAWRFGGYPQWTACSESSQSKISIATPQGKGNQQADLKFSGTMPTRSLHWKLHPWKDHRWRDGKTLDMSATQIAQEIEIDYEASQPGRIFGMFHEAYHVITWSEFEKVYGCRYIPMRWNLGSCHDVGTSEGHEPTIDWFARPPENDRFSDTIFWYRSFVFPKDWSIGMIAEGKWSASNKLEKEGMWQLEKMHKEGGRMVFRYISWEAESELRTFADDCKRYPVYWSKIKNPGPNEGIAQMQNLMQILPEPHGFVTHPKTGEPLFGRPRFVMIADDSQAELHCEQDDTLSRTQAIDDAGLLNPRFEIEKYHYPVGDKAKPVPARKPVKRYDNSMDNARYCCREWGPPPAEVTRQERMEQKMPEQLRRINLPTLEDGKGMTSEEITALMMARVRAEHQTMKEIEEEDTPTRRRGSRRRQRVVARRH